MYTLDTFEEIDYCLRMGYNPLLFNNNFDIEPKTRYEYLKRMFGDGHGQRANERFFRYMWDVKPHYCEECLKPLTGYSAVYISHIITRGSSPMIAHDPRNINILCFNCHNRWEHANTRKGMRIYQSNLEKIKVLKRDSLKLQKK
nr:MAG: NinG protein [Bacteriophage sp.]